LRATGIRIEELTELSHRSLVPYRLPTTGELVPLLQIAPPKTDIERLLVLSPELADVLSAVIQRVLLRGRHGHGLRHLSRMAQAAGPDWLLWRTTVECEGCHVTSHRMGGRRSCPRPV
jgi:hypothetical protein